jgi:hypothetical protein
VPQRTKEKVLGIFERLSFSFGKREVIIYLKWWAGTELISAIKICLLLSAISS